jgi:hypothetical protein
MKHLAIDLIEDFDFSAIEHVIDQSKLHSIEIFTIGERID